MEIIQVRKFVGTVQYNIQITHFVVTEKAQWIEHQIQDDCI